MALCVTDAFIEQLADLLHCRARVLFEHLRLWKRGSLGLGDETQGDEFLHLTYRGPSHAFDAIHLRATKNPPRQ